MSAAEWVPACRPPASLASSAQLTSALLAFQQGVQPAKGCRNEGGGAAAAGAIQVALPGLCWLSRLPGPLRRLFQERSSQVRTGRQHSPHLPAFFLNSCTSLPHVISRMGKLEQVDVNLFCLVATDFYRHQIEEELDRRAFQSVFEVVAAPGSPYHQLLTCLRNVHKVTTC